MKKKFILLAMMLLTLIGGVNLNVLNAQEQYRIKSVSTGKYLHIFNHDQHSTGPFGGVGVSDYEESVNQIFTFEPNGTGYRVKSADGYYIYCQQWNVDAYNTSSNFSTTLTGFDFNGESFSIGKMYSSGYFKVEYVSDGGNTYVFCNCTGNNDGTIETWKLEPVIVDDGIIPAAPTNLVATAIDDKSISLTWTAGDENALKYNIYQGGVNIGSTTETSYTVEGLTAETNYCFTVEAVRGVNVSESHSNEACATTLEAPATQEFTVGNGGSTSNYLPVDLYYGQGLTQQIYTKAQLNEFGVEAGRITKIAFYASQDDTKERNFDIYMINTSKSSFSSGADWVSMTESDKVYSGKHTYSSGMNEFVLSTPFEYDGNGSILICLDDNTGKYSTFRSFEVNSTGNKTAIYHRSDGTNYNPFNPSYTGTVLYVNNKIRFTIEVSTDPTIEVNYTSLDFGTVRAGGDFWTEKETPSFDVNVTAKNTTIESVSIDDNFFTSDKDLATAAGQAEFNFTVSYNKAAEAGEKSGNIVVTYMNGEEEATVEIPMTATAYVPAQGDVVENPIEVTFDENGVYNYTINSLDGFYDDYVFSPNEQYDADAPDMVFSFTLTEDALVTISNLGWSALYGDYTVENGPQYDVDYPDPNTLLSAGTYYAVCYPNSCPSEFSITKSSIPAPEISYSSPYDGEINQNNPTLEWNMQYADEYQVLFGTSEDALETVIDWNAVPQPEPSYYSYPTSGLQNNTKYYWQVNARNEAGTTTGEVQSFVTLLDVPQITSPTTVNLYPGETTTITWEAVANATSYKVYNGEWTVLATLEATETSYELSGLEYNMTGYNITVTATQEGLGESLKSTAVVVKVAGTFPLTVNVKDSNNNPIEGAIVTVDMAKAYDEFGVQVADMEAVTTDAEGKVTITFPLLGAYGQYGSSSFTPYYTLAVSKSPYTATSTTVSTAYGIPTSRDFTLYLPAPSNLYPENYEYIAGQNLTLNWTAVEGVTGYNVYRQGDYNNSTWTYEYELLGTSTENTYTTVAEYDGEGSKYAVSAVFEGGLESDKAVTYDYIYVLGTGDVKGLVTDTEGNPVAGAALELSGTNDFGEDIHIILETEADGTFFVEDVIEGDEYSLTVSHYNYEVATVSGISVNYNIENNLGTIKLTPKASIENVTVTADNNGNVSWTGDYTKWKVYRRNTNAPQELETVATELTTTSTTDAAWETLEPGTYQYGVAGFVEGGTEIGVQLSENFDDGVMPEGWINTNLVSPADLWVVNGGRLYSQWNGNYYLTISQVISTSGATMTFKYMNPPYNASRSEIHVYYSTSLDGELNEIATYSYTSGYNYQETSIDLSVISEEEIYITIANINTGEGGNGAYIDDLVITGEVTSEVETQIVWSNEVVKQGPNTFEGTVSTDWNLAANWSHGNAPEAGDKVIVNAEAVISGNVELSTLDIVGNGSVTVDANASLTVTGAITQEQDYSLIMNDGAQVFQNNANVTAQFNMNLVNPSDWSTSNKNGWQFISSPLSNVSVTNIAEGNYDLYKYEGDAELEWLNHKDVNFTDATYQHHIGYLASHETKTTLEFKGTLNYNDYYGSYAFYDYVEYYENEPLKNFYLIGNPYPFNISWADFKNNKGMVNGYAYVKEDGNYGYATSGEIAVGDGFFVQAISGTPDDPYSTYYYYLKGSGNTKSTRESNNSLNITATGNAGEDNVIINLAGKSEGFDKLQNFNDAIATVYVAEDGKNYGIYNCESDVQEIQLNFNANKMGNYTISIEPNGKFQTVTLVDRFTGIETNMLVEDYHFTAMSSDDNNRFIVKLVNGQESTDNSHFAYQSGEDLIVEVEGAVQIIDMLGRVVYSNDVESTNNRINVANLENATYIVRVINEEGVKVQKVVIY